MQLLIRKLGNSAGLILPVQLLSSLHLSVGAFVDASVERGVLTLKPAKPTYSLSDLLAQCDLSAPVPEEAQIWQDVSAVGHEAW